MMPWLDRNMGIVILVVTALILAGVALQSAKEVDVADTLLRRTTLEAGDYRATVSFNKGSDKPLVTSPQGRSLLDVSSWESTLTVNGTTRTLYRLEYNAHADGDVAYVTWSDFDYALEERIEVTDGGVNVEWRWLRKPDTGAQDVQLTVGHFAYYMENVTTDGASVQYELPPRDPRVPDERDESDAPYAVRVAFDRPPDALWLGETPEGIDAFHVAYRLDEPPGGQAIPIFRETITFQREPLPPLAEAELARVARPIQVQTPPGIRLQADEYHATIALGKGSDRPSLSTPDGRVLLDVSGWESVLAVNGVERLLYRHEYEVNLTHDEACLRWIDPAYALRECVHVSSENVTIRWDWLREPDAPPQDVLLTLAHFGFYMQDGAVDGRVASYGLPKDDPREAGGEADAGDVAYRVRVEADRDVEAFFGVDTEGRTDAFRFRAPLSDPVAGEWVPLLVETITYEEVQR